MPRTKSILLPLLCWVLLAACHDSSSTAVPPNTTPPTANAGTTQHVTIPVAAVTLDGSASSSADGGAITYAWAFVSTPTGSTATLTGSNTASPSFTPDVPGRYEVQLVVSEGSLTSTASTVTVGVSGTVDLLANGSFENGLIGWSIGTDFGGGATGTSGYNGVVAPGTETLTSVAGFPATNGTQIALGSVAQSSGAYQIISSVLYQDVFIPAEATTATISLDIGLKNCANNNNNDNAAKVGIYPTSTVPSYTAPTATGNGNASLTYAQPVDTTLNSRASTSFSVASVAGHTVRFAIINAANNSGHEVIGVDNVHFRVLLTF